MVRLLIGPLEKIIVTSPRFDAGVPATLSILDPNRHHSDKSPLLKPYPDWSWHSDEDCEKIISVYRTQVKLLKTMTTYEYNYTLSEAWSGVNWADLMAAQGAFGTDFYDRSTSKMVL